MPSSCVSFDDLTLLNLYAKFQLQRRLLGELYPLVRHDDSFLESRRYDGPASMMAGIMAQGHILSAVNTLNRFSYDLHSLTAWSKVFEPATEGEKMQALYEFVSPIASHSLSTPYSFKQMLVRSVCQISHQTNRFFINDWNECSLKETLTYKDAKRLAQRFVSWPIL
jgi:hypothetical protein